MHLNCLQDKSLERFHTTYNIELTQNAMEHTHDRKDFGYDMIVLMQEIINSGIIKENIIRSIYKSLKYPWKCNKRSVVFTIKATISNEDNLKCYLMHPIFVLILL